METRTIVIITVVIVALLLIFVFTRHEIKDNFTHDMYDVVIVGAGISGCYSAYRLRQQYPNIRMLILEKSNRVGGRLESVDMPHGSPDKVKAEHGGMR
jgi:monoamine oxidase